MKAIIRVTAFSLLVLCTQYEKVAAQTIIDTARNTALGFYKTYDSIPYLTFDVRYNYYSDTVYSDFTNETMKGTYTMSGKRAKYSFGDVEYLQNDSFLVAVYHNDQQIILSKPQVENTGSYLPLREALDSLLEAYYVSYDITVKNTTLDPETDSIGYISFVQKANDTLAIYHRYVIEFNIEKNFITSIEFQYTQPGLDLTPELEPDAGQRLLKNTDRKRTLRIDFMNYRFDNFSDMIYSENNYVWEEDGEYRPVEQYRNYKVTNARN